MKVLLVIDGMHPRDGGPPAVVAGSAIALRRQDINVAVLTTVLPDDEADVRKTWHAICEQGVSLQFCAPVGVKHLLRLAPIDQVMEAAVSAADVVHIHGFWSPALLIAAKMARQAGKPYFISTHGLLDRRAMTSSWRKWLKKRIAIELLGFRPIFRDAQGIIFGSETEDQESWHPVKGIRKFYISNGVEAHVGRKPISREARERLHAVAPKFEEWDRSLLFYSRLHPKKGVDMLIRAFNAVCKDFPGAGLLVAGIMTDETYGAHIGDLVSQCPAPDRIVLTTSLTGPESHFLYSLCDIFVLPSHAEGFSVALVEALAHARPSLITRYCHLPLVASEGAGIVVDPTSKSIEEGLRTLLAASDDALSVMGQKARHLFDQFYTWDRIAEQLLGAYSSAMPSHVRT